MSAQQKFQYRSAAGLEFNAHTDACPRISVRGSYQLADRIAATARRYGVPVIENSHLAQALSQLDVEEEIPIELYRTVAVVLAELESRF